MDIQTRKLKKFPKFHIAFHIVLPNIDITPVNRNACWKKPEKLFVLIYFYSV